jgi:hypothetical protein
MLGLLACAPQSAEEGDKKGPQEAPVFDTGDKEATKSDRWSDQDNPSLFDEELEYRVDQLPSEGAAEQTPWAGSYWPIYQDSINFKWDGATSASPYAKYGSAFGIDDLEDLVSSYNGIDHYAGRNTACETTSDCDADMAEYCAKRFGETEGTCIPTWWGICHAWAPVAIIEPEPKQAVTINGVEFKVNDLKALMTLLYDRSTSKFVSLRCNENDANDEITYDGYGSPTGSDVACKDTNPGTYHVLLTNYLGLRGASFVEDRTFDYQVWNQPLRAYRITKIDNVSAKQANVLVGMTPEAVPGSIKELTGDLNKGYWQHQGPYPVKPGGTIKATISGSGDADLYVRFGGKPTQEHFDCRPWGPDSDESCELDVPVGSSSVYISVFAYAATNFQGEIEIIDDSLAGIPDAYQFNDSAAFLYHVKLEVDYITESPSHLDGYLNDTIDNHTRTDHYQYVLEVDADAKIIGGEWIGTSKKNHPDFLWLPTGRRDNDLAGETIRYRAVKEILEASISPTEEDNIAQLDHLVDNVAKSAWVHYGPFEAGPGPVFVSLTGDGDADLYVRRGGTPTTGLYDCRPYTSASNERCSLQGNGSIYVSIRGYKASNFELTIRYPEFVPEEIEEEIIEEPGSLENGIVFHFDGPVDRGEWHHFDPIVIGTGSLNFTMTGTGDADLYVRVGDSPTTSNYDCRPYLSGSNESCTIVGPAEVYFGVRGYTAADFKLDVTFTPAPEATNTEDSTLAHLNESGEVAQGEMKMFSVELPAHSSIQVATTAPNDVDLYLKAGTEPTTSDYLSRGYTATGAETLTYTCTEATTLFIGVHGYKASNFTLKTTDL